MTDSDLLEVLRRALQIERPVLIALAGSNGAGKTTFHELYLERLGLPVVNADRIAQVLDPSYPGQVAYQAANLADEVRRDLMKRRLSFCMETVFSDPAGDKVQFLKDAQTAGYTVIGTSITLSDPALSLARVLQRVARGGHDVPNDKLQSRFERTAQNIRAALQFVDVGLLIDKSSAGAPYRVVELWMHGELRSPAHKDADADP